MCTWSIKCWFQVSFNTELQHYPKKFELPTFAIFETKKLGLQSLWFLTSIKYETDLCSYQSSSFVKPVCGQNGHLQLDFIWMDV